MSHSSFAVITGSSANRRFFNFSSFIAMPIPISCFLNFSRAACIYILNSVGDRSVSLFKPLVTEKCAEIEVPVLIALSELRCRFQLDRM